MNTTLRRNKGLFYLYQFTSYLKSMACNDAKWNPKAGPILAQVMLTASWNQAIIH